MAEDLKTIIELLPFLIPIFVLQLTLIVIAILDVIRRERVRGGNKLVWILVIVLVNILGPAAYLLFGRQEAPGRDVKTARFPSPSLLAPTASGIRTSQGTAIKTDGLSKHYGTVKALDHLDLEVPDNTVFGFLGPNGAGKTTTVKLLTGFANPTSGSAWVAGEKVGDGSLSLRGRTGLLPDVPAFYGWMTGREFMHFVGELHGVPRNEISRRADELLELVDLEKAGSRRIGGYSRGMRQRLGIAQSLINRPRVIFMDEPTSALDPIGRREVLDLIQRLREAATIFMSTHILSDVERVCDLVGIVDKGKLLTVSTVGALQRKYARSVFEMEFLEDPAPLVEILSRVDWLSEPQVTTENGDPVVKVRAMDLERARKELPHLVGMSGLTLCRYELTLPSLEEVFVEIFGHGETGV